jgi:hypothetical protein
MAGKTLPPHRQKLPQTGKPYHGMKGRREEKL